MHKNEEIIKRLQKQIHDKKQLDEPTVMAVEPELRSVAKYSLLGSKPKDKKEGSSLEDATK
jgi:hypothetical protein